MGHWRTESPDNREKDPADPHQVPKKLIPLRHRLPVFSYLAVPRTIQQVLLWLERSSVAMHLRGGRVTRARSDWCCWPCWSSRSGASSLFAISDRSQWKSSRRRRRRRLALPRLTPSRATGSATAVFRWNGVCRKTSSPAPARDLRSDNFAAYRLTAMAGDKHLTSVYRKMGKVSLALREIPAQGDQPPKVEITNQSALPVWPCWSGMNLYGALNQDDGKAVPTGKSRTLIDPFREKRPVSAACWFPHQP